MTVRTTGVTFEVDAARVTEIRGSGFGRVLLRHNLSVSLTPVIEEGSNLGAFRTPDRFQNWEFLVEHTGWARRLRFDWSLRRVLRAGCALELWTSDDDGWIHWLFPHTTWDGGLWRWEGRSRTATATPTVNDFPEGEAALVDGGFWKTTTPPPEGAVT